MDHANQVTVAAFYCFVEIDDCIRLRADWLGLCKDRGVRGIVLLANEGLNATIAGPSQEIQHILDWLGNDERFATIRPNLSVTSEMPFQRLKVRIKDTIINMGLPDVKPGDRPGIHVAPEDWHDLLDDPEVTLIDTRNAYEASVGTFEGAIDPGTQSFQQFPEYVARELDPRRHRKIAMFCTGGIRCEKASAYMHAQGFEQVYQLDGGILNYLKTIPQDDSRWHGECFVFDARVALVHGLADGECKLCRPCGMPVTPSAQASGQFEENESCPNCHGSMTTDKRARILERVRQERQSAR